MEATTEGAVLTDGYPAYLTELEGKLKELAVKASEIRDGLSNR